MRLAVIPARGGSKRIPRKNVRPFAGKPIIAYSIEAARASALFDRVIVSTEDDEIARVARDCGAETPFVRPRELSDDHTGTNAVVRHAISWFGEHGALPQHVCCIYATAPFVQPRYLREGYERLVASGKSFAFSVTSFAFPIQRALRIDADGCVQPIWPEYIARRSQDLEEAYHDAGQFYWGTARAFLDDVVLYSAASVPVILPRHLVQDIDTEEDWVRAELMFRALQAQQEGR
ncbi:MAG: pseudaminic acid cytidylyltransferase [Burkholderiaceae bacterium]|nr:pseudaminic acid cytidylyltransferase [Burkholderiaceae bacterium]